MEISIGSEGMGSWGNEIIYYLISKIYQTIKNENTSNCELIIKSCFTNLEKEWNQQPKKYIYWSGESYIPAESKYQTKKLYMITTIINLDSLYIPYFLYSPHLYKPRSSPNINRKYLLAYCSSNPIYQREHLYNLFVQKSNQCHALGNCYGNHPQTKLNKVEGGWGGNQLIESYTNYKFVLAMENAVHHGYITEKIVNAFYSGAIPIYWGCNTVVQHFNKKAFINVNDFNSFEECVDYVISLDNKTIQQMSEEPIYMDNELTHLIDDDWNKIHSNITLDHYVNKLQQFLE